MPTGSLALRLSRIALLVAASLLPLAALAEEQAKIDWQSWSPGIFERAKAEHRFVLLDLGAVWCHWCHVMDEVTYTDPAVISLLNEKYLAVRVDQDSRPDLSNRYEDYGWPATIVFNVDGSEIVKRSGYIPPKPMASLLQAIIDDPSPGPSAQPEPVITPGTDAGFTAEQRAIMREAFLQAYDEERGGWGTIHHYLDWAALEYCLREGASGDAQITARARQTLTSGLKLIDPIWGGVYQYSTDGDWDHPHFEKIMPFQAENLRVFSAAATQWSDPQWLEPAEKIRGYLAQFLTSPEGAFYTSQDADLVDGEHSADYFALDDAGRRAKGIPRVDRHLYARENGLAIAGLTTLYAAGGNAACLEAAKRAAEWTLAHRALDGGGFRHDERDVAGPYLADSLSMARACLALYIVTADRAWLAHTRETDGFIDNKFHSPIGFVTAAASPADSLPPKAQVDENITLARFANLLFYFTGDAKHRAMAEHAMRFLASPVVIERQGFATAGLLLADREFRSEPAHITIVGSKDDPAARDLFTSALRHMPAYTRLEWLDEREGPLPNSDVPFPTLKFAAAFVCANGTCSTPMRKPEQLVQRLAKLK